MKKIIPLVLAITILAPANAENILTRSLNKIKPVTTTAKDHINENKIKYIAGTTTTVALTAAGLYDYYYNDAKVMNAAAKIATKYSHIAFDKSRTGAEKLALLVQKNPVIAISAISGAAVLTTAGVYVQKDRAKGEDSKIRKGMNFISEKVATTTLKTKGLFGIKNPRESDTESSIESGTEESF